MLYCKFCYKPVCQDDLPSVPAHFTCIPEPPEGSRPWQIQVAARSLKDRRKELRAREKKIREKIDINNPKEPLP